MLLEGYQKRQQHVIIKVKQYIDILYLTKTALES